MTDMQDLLARQRAAYRREGAPTLAARRAGLDALETILLHERGGIARAISADFGNRSLDETVLLEVIPLLAAVRHLSLIHI